MGASSPLGTSIPGNIARAYEAFDGFWREQNQLYRDVATSFGISESAFSILYAIFLAGEKGISQRDICVQMCIGKQTVNSSIHKLEREAPRAQLRHEGFAPRAVLPPADDEDLHVSNLCPIHRTTGTAHAPRRCPAQRAARSFRLSHEPAKWWTAYVRSVTMRRPVRQSRALK